MRLSPVGRDARPSVVAARAARCESARGSDHGAPRFTGDLDILVRPTLDNGRRLLSAIAAFGFPTTTLTPDDVVAGNKVVEMGVVPVQIHVMSQIDGVTWEEVWQSRAAGTLGSRTVAFIGREVYLRNKRAAGRAKDLADIEALRDVDL
ncbi:MAG: hypothetical protein ABI634_10305 [Acidobacteriota bacterium]